ncbi:hypothetical protein [Planomonospora algeriensis]
MRIRFLAAAAVTAGALMTTLTGAANAAGTPSPAESFESSGATELAVPATPPDGAISIACKGGKGLVIRRVTEAELERLRAGDRRRVREEDVVVAVPALPVDGASEVRVPERGAVAYQDGPSEVRAPGEAVRGKRFRGKPHCVKAFPGKESCEIVKGRAVPAPSRGSSGSFHSSGPGDVVRARKLPGKAAVVCVTEWR